MLFLLTCFTELAMAETKYVTDEFEITLRNGESTTNSIISMLKTGQRLSVKQSSDDTRYSFVETEDGKEGYVLTRFLVDTPSSRSRLLRLQNKSDDQSAKIQSLTEELAQYKNTKQEDNNRIGQLELGLSNTENELDELTAATKNTVQILQQNDSLQDRIHQIEKDKELLTEENRIYKDSTAMDWFVRGAGVSLISFLLGILITRIRWKKQDSWGNY